MSWISNIFFMSIQAVVPALRALYGVHAVYIGQTILWHNYIASYIFYYFDGILYTEHSYLF